MAAYEVCLFSVSLGYSLYDFRSRRRRIFRTNFDDDIEEVFQRSTLDIKTILWRSTTGMRLSPSLRTL
ncbi:unnamed protein product [Brassica oleracea]